MDGAAQTSICPQCGSGTIGSLFCKNCGATLRPPISLVAPEPGGPELQSPPAQLRPYIESSESRRNGIFADAIALALIAVQLTVVFRWLVPYDETRFFAGILAYGVLVAIALFMWYGEKAETLSDNWVGVFFGSILLGAMSFGVDVLIGSSEYPGISPIRAGTKVGSPFGFILTIFLCPGITMVAAASVVRGFLVRGRESGSV